MSQFRTFFIILFLCGYTFNVFATSLYEEEKFRALHEDKKAHSLGDGLTILIYESTQATSSAGEGSSGEFKFSGGASLEERNFNAGVNLGSSNSGDAATNRNGFIRAQLTAIVIGSDENGSLIIEGKQTITINEEEQIITVKGKVRIEDITNQNTIASYRIQNAVISVQGDGEVSSGKNGNVFTRLARWMGF